MRAAPALIRAAPALMRAAPQNKFVTPALDEALRADFVLELILRSGAQHLREVAPISKIITRRNAYHMHTCGNGFEGMKGTGSKV